MTSPPLAAAPRARDARCLRARGRAVGPRARSAGGARHRHASRRAGALRPAPHLGRRPRGARACGLGASGASGARAAHAARGAGRQAALALDRVRLAEEAGRPRSAPKTEELAAGSCPRSRTISGPRSRRSPAPPPCCATRPSLDAAHRRELTETICEEARAPRAARRNLLDMTRLESGAVEPRREWVPLDEVVGVALTRLERRLAAAACATTLPEVLPLVSLDPVLVEQLFVNLLENAAKYTPPGSDIEDHARAREGGTLVRRGRRPRARAAGRATRSASSSGSSAAAHAGGAGVGLGLPISRAIAQAHGGTPRRREPPRRRRASSGSRSAAEPRSPPRPRRAPARRRRARERGRTARARGRGRAAGPAVPARRARLPRLPARGGRDGARGRAARDEPQPRRLPPRPRAPRRRRRGPRAAPARVDARADHRPLRARPRGGQGERARRGRGRLPHEAVRRERAPRARSGSRCATRGRARRRSRCSRRGRSGSTSPAAR